MFSHVFRGPAGEESSREGGRGRDPPIQSVLGYTFDQRVDQRHGRHHRCRPLAHLLEDVQEDEDLELRDHSSYAPDAVECVREDAAQPVHEDGSAVTCSSTRILSTQIFSDNGKLHREVDADRSHS